MRCATQGLRARVVAYRRGLEAATEDWTGRDQSTHACHFRSFCLPLVTIGAARSVAWHRSRVMRSSGWLSSWIFATQTQ